MSASAPEPSAVADLIDAAACALDAGDVDGAMAAVDALALVPLDGAERAGFLLAEGRLAAMAGRTRVAVDALSEAVRLADPGAPRVATAARLELIRCALRAGNTRPVGAVAEALARDGGSAGELAAAAVRVGAGDRGALDGIEVRADDLLVADGLDAAGLVAETAGMALVWGERFDDAARLLGRLVRSAQRAHATGPLPSVLAVRSLADLRRSDYRSAAAHADEAIRLADATHRPGLVTAAVAVLAVAEAIRGDVTGCRDAAARLADDAVRAGRDGGAAAVEVPSRAAVGLLHLGLGDDALAVAELEPLRGRSPSTPWLVMWQMDLAEALVRVGRVADAGAVLDEFVAGFDAAATGRAPGAAARVRALLVADDPDRAEAELERSEALLRDVGNVFGVARTLAVRGGLRRRWGREASGVADLHRAEALFARLGAEGWAAQAVAARLGTADTPAALVVPDPLTPQELQVARLVVTGRANREVAEALFVSARTVESHLGRIYRKLGIRSRSQLIARADDWGLRPPVDDSGAVSEVRRSVRAR
ncbi:MAG: helix-turn-helix transcriptional regulator [Acidimicrobiales bacterium]|nr:helix-turn-helix transcriptional regulator [Acidimicrobiales bacterium]